MGCSYPIKIKNKYYNPNAIQLYKRQKYYYVPCGKCLGCQISKRKWLNVACNYEYNKYGIGSFTTLTYDDEHILHLWDEETKSFLGDYKDFQLFIKKLRQNLYEKYGFRRDFKYLAVGEYGGETGRFHIHVLFFGLDWKKDDLIIWNSWGNGIADNRPIKTGGINYVLKYMDKAEMRNRNGIEYDFKKEQRPFMYHSLGLGKDFINDNYEDIINNFGTYDDGSGKRFSLPPYWLNKLNIKAGTDFSEIKKAIIRHKNKDSGNTDGWETVSRAECLNFLLDKSKYSELGLIKKSRDEGKPQNDFDDYYFNSIKKEIL